MIQIADVRAGLWFYRDMKYIGKVETQLDATLIGRIFSDDISIALNDFEAMSLTPEILEACGFKWETSEKKHLQIFPEGLGFYVAFYWPQKEFQIMAESLPEMVQIGDHIKYLHQLQNLYYSLTGSELTYNPKPKEI